MNSESDEPRTQYFRDKDVPISEILGTLCEQAGLSYEGIETCVWRLNVLFSLCYQQFYGTPDIVWKAWGCSRDVGDFVTGREKLPRYVTSACEVGLRVSELQKDLVAGVKATDPFDISGFIPRLIGSESGHSMA